MVSWEDSCIEYIGVTKDLREAGYVLKNGVMLEQDPDGQEHSLVVFCDPQQRFEALEDYNKAVPIFIDETGAIRVNSQYGNNLNFTSTCRTPTSAQARILGRGCREADAGGCWWDIIDNKGTVLETSGPGVTTWGSYLRALKRCEVVS